MKHPLQSTFALLAFLTTAPLAAQLEFGGHPYGLDRALHGLPEPPVVVMGLVDPAPLLAEDAARLAAGMKGPWRYGVNHPTDLRLDNSGVWTALPNGDQVWQLAIECPGALNVSFVFDEYIVPEGARVFVHVPSGEQLGAFTAASNGGRHVMGVAPMPGDRIVIEYIEPAAVAGQGHLHIGEVTHGYRDILNVTKDLGDSGACNNNVICPIGDPWRKQIRSVARIFGSGFLCTGQLLNNCNQNGTPYFLTANHCTQGGINPASAVFRFRWESPTCTPTQNGPTNMSLSGAQQLANNAGSDMALLELNTTPPDAWDVYYSGWNKTNTPATSVTAIHHPSGDIKKISIEQQPVSAQPFSGAQCWHIAAWDDGTTEGGSSGSGLWDQHGLLVGQLYGGQASCSYNFNDYYGRFDVSFPHIDQFLGNCGDTLTGFDPGATGLSEQEGTFTFGLVPNPTTGAVLVTLPERGAGVAVLRVTDALGRVVAERNLVAGTVRTTLDLDGQADGLYLVELRQDGHRVVQRLVLER
ncbi:MAG: trypsin-like peptidase domain-containing protein [Flavobacteriales bacterium]|nr:Protease 1 [Flavobacteriales bacterium]MCC6578331.1 trypsin-like peptidase domain-containing protein [Flavobacteriales bacterium]NUQ13688.1 trypsin-like peptidase domain-containing protein [Flavobacteriales bacterium]